MEMNRRSFLKTAGAAGVASAALSSVALADKATAEDVAQTLGITNVEQSDGLVTPIVVVLLN